MLSKYEENKQYLRNEFVACHWDRATGMDVAELEEKANQLWNARGDEAVSVAKAKIQRFIVKNAQLEVNPHSLFAGKLNYGIQYDKNGRSGSSIFERLFKRIREETLRARMPEVWADVKFMDEIGVGSSETDFWHTMPDWERILKLGFAGLKEEALATQKRKEAERCLSDAQRAFYQSVLIVLDAIDIFIGRLIDYGEKLNGMEEYIACLRHIRIRAPETLYHSLMTAMIYVYIEEMGCERARTLGRFDVLNLPFYLHDIRNGIYSIEEEKEFIRYFFGRYSQAGRFAAQPLCIGGTLADGSDAWNEFTDVVLDVYDGMNILDPKIHVRWYPGFPSDRLRRIMRMVRSGHSAFVLVSDKTVYRAYEKIGIPQEISRNYTPLGCYEPMIAGVEDAMIGASWTDIAKAVELVFGNGVDMTTGKRFGPETGTEFASFDAFMTAFYTQLDEMVNRVINGIEHQNTIAMDINPSPLYSCSVASCMESGRDVFEGGMTYNNVSVKCCGIGTTVDALAAVKQLVFEKKEVSWAELRRAVLNNWQGYELLHAQALTLRDKFGNNMPLTNQLAREVYHHLYELYVGRKAGIGGVYRMGADSITRCISLGQKLWATPDGRMTGQIISKNFCGTVGREVEGITASLLSALAIDQTEICDAAVLDYVIHPSAVEGEAGLDAMVTFTETYLNNGGFALQGNVMQVEELKDAQKHPEKYPNLQVRVCGWNEYFVNMQKEIQNAFIKRLEV